MWLSLCNVTSATSQSISDGVPQKLCIAVNLCNTDWRQWASSVQEQLTGFGTCWFDDEQRSQIEVSRACPSRRQGTLGIDEVEVVYRTHTQVQLTMQFGVAAVFDSA